MSQLIAEHAEERWYKNSQQFVDIFCEWPPKREVDAHFGFESMMGPKGNVIVGRGLLQIGFHLAVQVCDVYVAACLPPAYGIRHCHQKYSKNVHPKLNLKFLSGPILVACFFPATLGEPTQSTIIVIMDGRTRTTTHLHDFCAT